MNKLAWACVFFGWAVAGVIVLATVFDIGQAETGRETISRWCLSTSQQHPWIAVLLTAPIFLVLGILIGHLWFPQYLSK